MYKVLTCIKRFNIIDVASVNETISATADFVILSCLPLLSPEPIAIPPETFTSPVTDTLPLVKLVVATILVPTKLVALTVPDTVKPGTRSTL